jgi:hypothetical protein
MATNGNGALSGDLAIPSKLARLNYFFGQLLTQRDLKAEQGFHLQLQRLVQRETFGTGTVAGLRVDPAAEARPRGVFLRGGLAMDPGGRELMVADDVCVVVAHEPLTPGNAGLTGNDNGALASQLSELWGAAIDKEAVALLTERLVDAGAIAADSPAALRDALNQVEPPEDFALAPGTTLSDHLFDSIVATTYVGLRYHERGAEPSPSTLDASCCGDAQCFPARIQEGVVVVLQSEPFPAIEDPFDAARTALSACFLDEENPMPPPEAPVDFPFAHACHTCLCDYVLGAWRGAPEDDACRTDTLPVVPLAIVTWLRYAPAGDASRILAVDNCSIRPLAPGVPPVRALLDVITQCTSLAAQRPRVVSIEPANRGELFAAGVTSAVVRAHVNGRIRSTDAKAWELEVHPAGGREVLRFSGRSNNPPSDGFKVKLAVDEDGGGNPTIVALRFTGRSANQPLDMPAGTYVWRINVPKPSSPDKSPIVAAATEAPLDGGVYEARFFVR